MGQQEHGKHTLLSSRDVVVDLEAALLRLLGRTRLQGCRTFGALAVRISVFCGGELLPMVSKSC